MNVKNKKGKPSAVSPARRKKALKQLNRCLQQLADHIVFVEGQRDRAALQRLGCSHVYTISGNLVLSCNRVAGESADEVVVLTDLDRRGNEMLERACDELERYSIRCNRETRKTLGRVLRVKYFEQLDRKWMEFLEDAGD